MKYQLTLIALCFLQSCSPFTKEQYISQYESFINDVRTNSADFSKADWLEQDEKYAKYSEEYYAKFKDQLDWKELAVVKKCGITYNIFKAKNSSLGLLVESFAGGDYSNLKDLVKYYAENNLDQDLQFIIEQANEIGGDAIQILDDIFLELDIDLNVKISPGIKKKLKRWSKK